MIVRLLGHPAARGLPPGAQPDRLAGLGDRAAAWTPPARCSSRCTRACSRPVWLRALGAKIGRDVEASTVLLLPEDDHRRRRRVPRRRHHDRVLRARRRLAAHRPAKVGKRAFLGNSGMAAPGRVGAQERPRRGAVRRARRRPRRARRGSVSPPVKLRRARPTTADQSRTFDPPRGSRSPARWSSCAGCVPVIVHRRDRRVGVLLTLQGLIVGGSSVPRGAVCGAVVLLAAGAVAGARGDGGQVAARRPARVVRDTRCGARSSGATRWSTPSSRWSPRRGSRAPRRVRRCSTCGCARSARGSAGASGARPTGCPRPTWSRSATAPTVNRGCVLQTHLFHDRIMRHGHGRAADRAPRSGRTASSCPPRRSAPGATVGPASLVMRGEAVPGRHPLDRQPDRALERDVKHAHDSGHGQPRSDAPPATRTCPTAATAATGSTRYELDLAYRVSSNRLTAGPAITAVAARAAVAVQPRPGRPAGGEGDRRRPGARSASAPRRKLHRDPGSDVTVGADASPSTSSTPGNPRPRPRSVGRARLGGAHRRASSSPASPTARRPGSPATTTPATRRSYRITVTTDSPYRGRRERPACWTTRCAAAATTWVFDQPEPMATYLATRADRPVRTASTVARQPVRHRRRCRQRRPSGLRDAASAGSRR